ncbi:MAG: hypothetical protein U9O59_02530 [Actinomycetota bacterium]|nr:hypothetical protein [Actinomycetota bacterium]
MKRKILKSIVIISTLIVCIVIQYALYFLEKSIYLGSLLMLIVSAFFVFLGFSDKELLILDGLFIIACPILFIFSKFDFSNYIALNIIVLSFLAAAVYLLKDKLASFYRKSGKINFKKKIGYILVFLIILFIILSVASKREETENALLEFFQPEKYYKEIDKIELDGAEYENEVKVVINKPQDGDRISGLFELKGWAADLSDIEDASIDKIYVFLNNKPQDGGLFLERVDTKIRREDIAQEFGDRYKDAGYYMVINSRRFEDGLNKIYVYAHSNYFGWDYAGVEIYVEN